jgi:hypothetical protein
LFNIGPEATTFSFGAILANSCVQNFLTIGSVILFTTLHLKTSEVNIIGIESIVVFGYSISAKIVFLKICSNLGPQLSQNILLKIHISHDAIKALCLGFVSSSILKAIGESASLGSKIIV